MKQTRHLCGLLALLLCAAVVAQVQAAPAPRPQQNLAPTYRIYATREGLVGHQTANGHIIQERDHFVALPSWRVLSSYQGYEYQVRVTYNGRTAVAPVWDVGPWNTDDNYWSPNRHQYPDLPIGMPQAQAAFFDGHNNGLDEFGRVIRAPNGIDIADGLFWDTLGMTGNDWVEVSFLWLGEDPGPGAAVQEPIPAPPSANSPPAPDTPAAPPAEPAAPAAPQPPAEPPLDNPSVPGGALAVDNDDTDYSGGDMAWDEGRCGLNGSHTWATAGAGSTHRAMWTPMLDTGTYEVQVYIPGCGEGTPTSAARYTVLHDGGEREITLDQRAQAGTWASLGIYSFGRQTSPTVHLRASDSDSGVVRFDAVAWLPVADAAAPESRVTRIVRDRNGYLVEWSGEDDASGIASYDVQFRQLPSGGWRNWRRAEPDSSAWFGPDEGHHFAFRVRARDYAGNEEAWRDAADMDTTSAEPEPEP
jgi:hypothetical protein